MAIRIKNEDELDRIAETGRILGEAFAEAEARIRSGVRTAGIDRVFQRAVESRGAVAEQIGYHGYPAASCISRNEVVVHGIPDQIPLREGDLVKLDASISHQGLFADMARSYPVGKVTSEVERLLRVTEEAFWVGFELLQDGTRLGDVSAAVQAHVEAAGLWVVREFIGHGIGYEMHEDPELPNYGRAGTGPRLRDGMVLALEPMVTLFPSPVVVSRDGWTATSGQGNLAAHYENTVAVTRKGPRLLSGVPVGGLSGKR